MKIESYPKEIEAQMLTFFNSLSEKDRRRYAAVEAFKLGFGGSAYIHSILKCDLKSMKRGMSELEKGELDKSDKIRVEGGGRKRKIDTISGLNDAFLQIIADHTAGSPEDENILWTNLSRKALAETLNKKGYSVSVTVVKQLLKENGFHSRKAFKIETAKKDIKNRDEQFVNITNLKEKAIKSGNPVVSMDVKKRNDR